MHFELAHFNNPEAVGNFLEKNGVNNYKLNLYENHLVIEIDADKYSAEELDILQRHFSYYDIFLWSEKGVENVTLWEKPRRVEAVIREYRQLLSSVEYSLISSIEARGFILGGIFARELKKPFVTIRKYKVIYDALPGYKYQYQNWKGQKEELYIFTNPFGGEQAILIDDIIETGNSLHAAKEMLGQFNIEIAAAFYLLDATSNETRQSFSFPIRSLLRFDGLFDNRPIP
ncbi:MAG: phosphoribosyltransferase family protein [Halanaerobium sp.]|nr:phosphoribosyltransferase family protein [Halanaerobium sp.]